MVSQKMYELGSRRSEIRELFEYGLKRKAEIGADNVKFDRVELDYDDGVWQYEVVFRHGDIEYDIDINAENGEILSFEKDREAGF